MANDQLVSYLRQQLIAGVSKEEIRAAALAAQWMPSDITEAFAIIDAVDSAAASGPVPLQPKVAPAPVEAPAIIAPATLATPHRSYLIPIFVSVVLLVSLGGVAFAYFAEIGPFSVKQYSEASFFTDLMTKAAQITTASYKASVSLAVNPRDADATTFAFPAVDPDHEQQYKDDAKRVSDIGAIATMLTTKYGSRQSYDFTKRAYVTTAGKSFPAVLSSADLKNISYSAASVDPVTKKPYTYAITDGGKNFTLSATLVTTEALSALRDSYYYNATSTPISGQQVTFTKDSGYTYISSTLPKPFLVQLSDMSKSIPPGVSGSVAVAATTDFSGGAKADWHFGITANGDLGDLTYAFDVEALKKDKNYYVRVNKMPAFFLGSLASYKGKWIVIDPAAASSTPGSYNEFSSVASSITTAEGQYKQNRDDSIAASKELVQLMDKDKLIAFKSKPVSETVDGRDLYKYSLQLNKASLIPFYKDLIADEKITKALKFTDDPALLSYLQSKDFDQVYDYLDKNVFLTFWTDKSGFPAQIEYRLRVVPPDAATQLAGKQIDVIIKLVYTDINKPVNIEVPADTTPIQTVIDEMNPSSGNTKDEIVKSELDTVRTQAVLYWSSSGTNSYGTQKWSIGAATACTGGMFKNAAAASALLSADTANGVDKKVLCYAYGTGYLMGAELSTKGWQCVDSAGTVKTESSDLTTALKESAKTCP